MQAPIPATTEYFLSPRARSLLRHLRSVEGVAKAIDSFTVIDVRLRGSADDEPPLLPQAVSIEVNPADAEGPENQLAKLDPGQQCIILRNVLQYLPDYRRFVGAAFAKLAISGCLIVVVPHQFLLERKLVLPSRVDTDHLRFYTPGTLMTELEEAIDPLQYRVRMLSDNDDGYDYSLGLGERPRGSSDIVVCLERIEKPSWWRELETQDRPVVTPVKPMRYPLAGARDAVPNLIVEPDDAEIRRIIVLKLDHRGDFLLAQEAFDLLRRSFPGASITLVCGGWNKDQAAESGLFDRVIPFDFFPEDASSVVNVVTFAESAAKFKKLIGGMPYDLAIDLRLYEDTRELLRLVNANVSAGFDSHMSFQWLTIPLNLPIPTRHGRAQNEFIAAPAFMSRLGEHRGFEIAFENAQRSGRLEYLTWGPYTDLGTGNFEFEVLIEPIGDTRVLSFDISAEAGKELVAAGDLILAADRHPRIKVAVRRPLRQFEFRLLAASDAPLPRFRFRGLRYVREGFLVGTHQEEAMSLLVHLVQMRLKHAYVTTRS